MSYLQTIPELENENMSGLVAISLVRVPDVLYFPDAFDGIAVEPIVFHVGKDWIRWMATYRTSNFARRAQETPEGILTLQDLPFIIPRHSSELTAMLRLAERDEFIVLFKDANGHEYLWGNPQKPVKFIFNQATGDGSGRNQYECRFYSESSENILSYPANFGTEPIYPDGRPVVIRRGSVTGPVLAVVPSGATVVVTSPYNFAHELILQ